MKLNKKRLASRALNVGMDRIVFNKERLADIKNAITKQDIRDLVKDGAIAVREIKGRRTNNAPKKRRRAGSVRKKVGNTKAIYVMAVRKLRSYLKELRKQNLINREQFIALRKELRTRKIQNKSQVKERISQLKEQ